jgi:hypothetical protein
VPAGRFTAASDNYTRTDGLFSKRYPPNSTHKFLLVANYEKRLATADPYIFYVNPLLFASCTDTVKLLEA